MPTHVDINKVGYFILSVDKSKFDTKAILLSTNLNNKIDLLFLVKSFTLSKQINKPVKCSLLLVPGTLIISSNTYADGMSLIKMYMKLTILNIHCKLIQVIDNNRIIWFSGYIAAINPTMDSSGSNTKTRTHISCLGDLMDLMFSPVKDFACIPSTNINTDSLDYLYALQLNRILSNTFQGLPISYDLLIGSSNQLPTDDIATMLVKFNNVLNLRLKFQGRGTTNGIDLAKYLLSNTYITDSISTVNPRLINQNAYVRSLNTQYLVGTTQKTIWDGIVNATLNKYLQLIPPSIDLLNNSNSYKYKIRPNFPSALPRITLDNGDISGLVLAANPILRLDIPDMLAVNVKMLSRYDSGQSNTLTNAKASNCYGLYPPVSTFNNIQLLNIKVIDSPDWLLNTCANVLNHQNTLLNKKSDTIDKQSNLKQSNTALTKTQLLAMQTTLDNYAKATFYYLYASNKNAAVDLPYNTKNLYMDSYLGLAIDLQINSIGSLATASSSIKMWGMLTAISYKYKSADILALSNSSLNISLNLNQILMEGSRFLSIYKQPLVDTIYYIK